MPPVRSENSPVEAVAAAAALPPGQSPAQPQHSPNSDLQPAPQSATEPQLSDAWNTLRKRKWLILAFALLGAAYGFYKGSTQPRLYDSAATIELHSGSASEFKIGTTTTGGEGTVSRIATQLAILKSDALMLAVARSLNLANDPEFMGDPKGIATHRNLDDPNDPALRQSVIGTLQGQVGVSVIARTDLLKISCTGPSARLSAEIPNQLVRAYIQRSLQSRADASKRVNDFYSNQLADLKQEVETSQAKLIDLQKQLGALGFDPGLNQYTTNLTDLNHAVDTAEIARINAESRLGSVAGVGGDIGVTQPYPSISPTTGLTATTDTSAANTGGSVSTLRSQVDADRAALAQLTAPGGLGPQHPRVLALKEQISELKVQIAEAQHRNINEARQNYLAARSGESHTRAVLEAEKTEDFKLRDKLVDYTLRQREFESNRSLYEGLQTRLRTAAVQAGLESTEIDIVDAAVPALGPSLRPRSSFLLMNTLVMLIVGIIAAFILEALDNSLRSITQLETVTGLPTLALIPRTRRAPDHQALSPLLQSVAVLSSPKSQFAESFRSLRTSLLLSVAGHQPRVILLTSSSPAEGKTTVSLNLACILAQQNQPQQTPAPSDVRVLLIDADLRRPTVHHRLGLQGRVGLTSLLTGSITLDQAIQKVPGVPALDVLVSGPIPPFPTEMLSSATMHDLLETCRGLYTHIVIDSPPLLSVTDSVVLAREADAVVLVVRYGKSTRTAVRRARDILARAGAGIAGIVLNAVELNSPEYRSYHGEYGYGGYGGYASEGNTSTGWRSKSNHFLEDQQTGPKGDRP